MAIWVNYLFVQVHDEHKHDPHGEDDQTDGGYLGRILTTYSGTISFPTLTLCQLYLRVWSSKWGEGCLVLKVV